MKHHVRLFVGAITAASLSAECVIEGIRALPDSPLAKYLLAKHPAAFAAQAGYAR
jgi:hypothetical protein